MTDVFGYTIKESMMVYTKGKLQRERDGERDRERDTERDRERERQRDPPQVVSVSEDRKCCGA